MDSAANIKSIHSLIELKDGLNEFCSDAQQSLDAIARDIMRFQEWLAERQRYWQRQVEDEIEGAYEELQNVRYWRNLVEEVIANYQSQAYRLSNWLQGDIPKAAIFLGETATKLDRFINVGVPSSSEGFSTASSAVTSSDSVGTSAVLKANTIQPSKWIETGIQNVSIQPILSQIDLNTSHVKTSKDFSKVSYEHMVEGFHKLQTIVLPAVENGADGDYFASLDATKGLQYENGYERVYDAFYGNDAIRLNKIGEKYDIVNGYHRLFVAKELGIETIPAQVVERK